MTNYNARVDVWRAHGGTFDDVLSRLQRVMRADLEIGA
jgi:hypothetical protein